MTKLTVLECGTELLYFEVCQCLPTAAVSPYLYVSIMLVEDYASLGVRSVFIPGSNPPTIVHFHWSKTRISWGEHEFGMGKFWKSSADPVVKSAESLSSEQRCGG